jgi:hypothetical protein
MSTSLFRQVRRVAVTDELATGQRYDYADSFEVDAGVPDPLAPRSWLAAGLEDSPAIVRVLATVLLRVQDEPAANVEDLVDWEVLESTPELIYIERSLPLLHVTLIGRRLGSSGRRLTTLLTYRRPLLSRSLWAFAGVGHRLGVRRLICHGLPARTAVAGAAGR